MQDHRLTSSLAWSGLWCPGTEGGAPQRALSDLPTWSLGLSCLSISLSHKSGGSEGCGCTVPRMFPLTRWSLGFHPSSWATASLHSAACVCRPVSPPPHASLTMGTSVCTFRCWTSLFHAVRVHSTASCRPSKADMAAGSVAHPLLTSLLPLCLAAVDAALVTICPTLRLDPCSSSVSRNEEQMPMIPEGRKLPACSRMCQVVSRP